MIQSIQVCISIVAKSFGCNFGEIDLRKQVNFSPTQTVSGTRIDFDKEDFVRKIHEFHNNGAKLVDGYAPVRTPVRIATANQKI